MSDLCRRRRSQKPLRLVCPSPIPIRPTSGATDHAILPANQRRSLFPEKGKRG